MTTPPLPLSAAPRGPIIAALSTTLLLWGSAFVGIRAVLSTGAYNPFHLALVRYTIASLVLGLVAVPFGVRVPKLADVPRIAISGFLGVAIYNVLLNLGQTMMKAGAASFIVNTIPLFTAILSMLFLKDRLRPAAMIGMAISFAGIVLIALGEGKSLQLNAGAAAILIAAIAWSGATILQKPLLQRYRALEIVSYAIWSGTLCMMWYAPGAFQAMQAAPLRINLIVVFLGVFPAALAYVCWAYALSHFPASRASSFLYLVPIISTLVEIAWFREVPGLLSFAGGCVALTGVFITNTVGRARPAEPAKVS